MPKIIKTLQGVRKLKSADVSRGTGFLNTINVNTRRTTVGLDRLCAFAMVALSVISANTNASQNGIDGYSSSPHTNGGASCLACHSPASSQTATLSISGPTVVNANSTNEYVVTINGGPASTAGIDISVDKFDGRLAPVSNDLRVSGDDLTHRTPKSFSNGQVQFRFRWTAPGYNATTDIYAAANSSNGNLDLIGDSIVTEKLPVQIRNGSGTRPEEPNPGVSLIKLETFATGLSTAVSIANAGDSRLFVVDQNGFIRVVQSNGNVLSQPFLNVSSRITREGGEQGLLGLAFDPNYANNGYFYIHYVRKATSGMAFRGVVSRFSVSGNNNVANAGSEKVLLEIPRNGRNHNGGDLRFGNDGYLYISVGDGADIFSAKNINSLSGKILRIDVSGSAGPSDGPDCGTASNDNYRIPPGNAYRNGRGNGCDEIYALGLRNPWRISLDRATGDLWIGDVGQNSLEEVDYIKAGGGGGVNLGWPCYEGNIVFNQSACTDSYVAPVHTYGRGVGRSITGGFVYRGNAIPSLRGRYLFSDYGVSSKIYSLVQRSGGWLTQTALGSTGKSGLSSFGEDASGELYVASAQAGEIYRIVDGNPVGGNSELSVSGATVTEGINDRARVRVTLSPAANSTVSVRLATSKDTAEPITDFFGISEALTFAPGQTVKEVDITIVDDDVVEPQESFNVRLIGESGASVSNRQAQVVIRNDDTDAGDATLSISSISVNEADGQAEIQVQRSRALSATSSVKISTTSGSAKAGEDFYGGFSTVTVPANATSAVHVIPIIDDTAIESNEAFGVRIFDPSGAVLGNANAQVTIVDDDSTDSRPVINVAARRVTESNNIVSIPVTLSKAATQPVIFTFSTNPPGTATPGQDYYGNGGQYVFLAGQRVRDIPIQLIDDDLTEGTEHFNIRLVNIEGAVEGNLVAKIDIVDNDGGVAGLKVYPMGVDEDAGIANVLVKLSQAVSSPVTVDYATSNDTAQQGSDYFGSHGEIRFAPGQTAKRIAIDILDDNIAEPSELFKVRIYNPVGAQVTDPIANILIRDND